MELTLKIFNPIYFREFFRQRQMLLWFGLLVLMAFSATQVHAGRGAFNTQYSAQQDERFKSEGPLTPEVVLDDKGKPPMAGGPSLNLNLLSGWPTLKFEFDLLVHQPLT
jgi:hypothetical protein